MGLDESGMGYYTMSVPFISIKRGDNLQTLKFRESEPGWGQMYYEDALAVENKTILDELLLALEERRNYDDNVDPPTLVSCTFASFQSGNGDGGGESLWAGDGALQITFINLLREPAGGGGDYLNYNTIEPYDSMETFFNQAGLNENGFRSAVEFNGIDEPTWVFGAEYGLVIRGDIIGAWIFTEIQRENSEIRYSAWAGLIPATNQG